MGQSDKSRSLKNILIKPSFQIKLLFYFIILFIITSASLYSTTFLFFWNLKNKGLKVGIPEGHVFFNFLENQKSDLDLLFLGLVSFNFILLISIGLVISHRIAGPLFKLQEYLKHLTSDSPELKLRENDFFYEIVPVINKLKDKIK